MCPWKLQGVERRYRTHHAGGKPSLGDDGPDRDVGRYVATCARGCGKDATCRNDSCPRPPLRWFDRPGRTTSAALQESATVIVKLGGIGAVGSATLVALSLLLTPALAATSQPAKKARPTASLRAGTFTPAVADPRLAAELARRGVQANSFRFTPAPTSINRSQSIRVAIRARAATPAGALRRAADVSATPVTAITPTVYNLGASVGWKRFALSGDVDSVKGGTLPGGRKAAEVGVSYSGSRFTARAEAGVAKADPATPRIIAEEESYTVGVGGSYRIARNLDVTGGVRYKIQRDRLEALADPRRDSQAVYVGTAFRF
ncbi:MAG: porin [Allosphingosinicella sp.]